MARILRGKEVSDALTEKLLDEVDILKGKNIKPSLAIVRVGINVEDISYEESAIRRCEKIGINVERYILPEGISQVSLLEIIHNINIDDRIHGVLLFRPLPKQLDDHIIRSALAPHKDVDGITDISMAGVYSGSNFGFPPCTARACMEILDFYGIDISGKSVVIIGRSLVVGKPAAMMALKKNGTVTICHTNTNNLEKVAARADILIVAAGAARIIGPEYVNVNQIIIDAGINLSDEGKLCGDVDFDKVESLVSAITPVPGGVGTVTTGVLLLHIVEAAKLAAV
jgi:methylenetetrahydrofolate dehydrogenase (NADP+)/methenyltetrahydrofolate cyclohydrolase